MVVHRHREDLLRVGLADDVFVEDLVDFARRGKFLLRLRGVLLFLDFFADDVVAELDALVAHEHRRAGNQLAHLMLALAAEGAIQQLLALAVTPARMIIVSHSLYDLTNTLCIKDAGSGHYMQVRPQNTPPVIMHCCRYPPFYVRFSMTLSISPKSSASEPSMKLSRSVSSRICSRVRPVCLTMIWLSRSRTRRISRAWMSISVAWPWNPPIG